MKKYFEFEFSWEGSNGTNIHSKYKIKTSVMNYASFREVTG